MKLVQKLLACSTIVLLAGFITAVFGQSSQETKSTISQQEKSKTEQDKSRTGQERTGTPTTQDRPGQDKPGAAKGESSMTGCLSKEGTNFVLTDESTGRKVTVTGTADLEKHSANHKVKVTGSTATEQGKEVFKVSKLEHISATCEAKK